MALCAACDADIHDANPLAAGVFGLAAEENDDDAAKAICIARVGNRSMVESRC